MDRTNVYKLSTLVFRLALVFFENLILRDLAHNFQICSSDTSRLWFFIVIIWAFFIVHLSFRFNMVVVYRHCYFLPCYQTTA